MTSTVMGTILKIALAILIVVGVYRAATSAYEYGFRLFAEPPMETAPGTAVNLVITDNKSDKEIAELLQTNGLIRDAKLFRLQERISEYYGKIQPGAYELNTSMTAEEILAVIAPEPTTEEENTP